MIESKKNVTPCNVAGIIFQSRLWQAIDTDCLKTAQKCVVLVYSFSSRFYVELAEDTGHSQ